MDIIGWLDECARDFREARAALQHAEGITEIACTFVGPADNVHGASVLLEERGVAEAPLCIDAGCLGRHAGGKIVRGAHLEVRTKLFVKFTIQSLSSQQPLQARDDRYGTPLFQANRRTWRTARVRRSQFCSSSASCLRPAEVRR